MPSLDKELLEITKHFKGEILLVKEFISLVQPLFSPPIVDEILKRPGTPRVQRGDSEELRKIAQLIESGIDGKNKKVEYRVESKLVEIILTAYFKPIKHKEYFAEMTTVYIVSLLEAFLKNYLKTIFIYKPETLKTKSQITFDVICSHRSMKALILTLAQSEVDMLGYGSIEDMQECYDKRFKCNFNLFESWNEIVESSYRRNIIVHNRGIINNKYKQKFKNHRLGSKLDTTTEYTVELCDHLQLFFDFVNSNVGNKFARAKI